MIEHLLNTPDLIERRLTVRPATAEDDGFVYRVYASTRAAEMALVDWTEAQQAAFIRMQFQAQHTYYHQQFPEAAFLLIAQAGVSIGRLYVDRRPAELGVVDIALLPEYRGQGIGSLLMGVLLAEGQQRRLPVRLYVEQFNPARRLYARLGFHQIGSSGIYQWLEWTP